MQVLNRTLLKQNMATQKSRLSHITVPCRFQGIKKQCLEETHPADRIRNKGQDIHLLPGCGQSVDLQKLWLRRLCRSIANTSPETFCYVAGN